MHQSSGRITQDPIRGDRRVIFGWVMYDWANSAYVTTMVSVILPIYFAEVIIPSEGFDIGGISYAAETLWGFTLSAAALLVFAAAPVLGAVADFSGTKKRFLGFFCYLGVTGSVSLSFCGEGSAWPAMILFVISQIGFVGANVFYDAFLPQIAPEDGLDRISSRGFAFGYIGGGLQFTLALGLLAGRERLGLSEPAAARFAMLSAALWWGGFAVVSLRCLRERHVTRGVPKKTAAGPWGFGYLPLGVSRVWKTVRKVRRLRHLVLFLGAFLAYNEGIQTVIQMASMFGKQELGLPSLVIMSTFLFVQVVAFLGAFLFARIAGRIGSKRAVMVALLGWAGTVGYAYFIRSATEFVLLGGIIGLVLGGSQAISRSLYAYIIPEDASAEFFGFYSVINKFSAVWGPLIYALVRHWTGTSRSAVLSLIFFFFAGMVMLSLVDEKKARKASAALAL